MKKKTVQVIYKCNVGHLTEDAVSAYLETEKTRITESMNGDENILYNVTIIPMSSNYSCIETLPTYD